MRPQYFDDNYTKWDYHNEELRQVRTSMQLIVNKINMLCSRVKRDANRVNGCIEEYNKQIEREKEIIKVLSSTDINKN